MSILRSVSGCLTRFARLDISSYYSTNGTQQSNTLIADMANANAVDANRAARQKRIVWIDLEMSGLDVNHHKILEVACLITDENLNIISDEFHMVLNQPEEELNKMDEWCKRTHGNSGLIEKVRASKVNEKKVDEELLFFMMRYIPKNKCPMAGNSVYMDRLFLRKYMPSSNDYIHYRIIDVSSIKEVVKRWKPEIYSKAPQKKATHTAVLDVKESIDELEYYRKHVFMNGSSTSKNL